MDYLSGEEESDCYSSDQESLDVLDNEETGLQPVSSRGNSAKVITKESLLAAQTEDLRRVMELLSLKEHHARTLLIHYRWDVEKLFAVLVEKGKDILFSSAGLTVLENQRCDDSSSFSHDSITNCDICLDDVFRNQMTKMDCGHCFCNNCWAVHFTVKIEEGQSKRIRCMADKCNAVCDEDVVRTLVSKTRPDLAEKFDRILLESYIEDNKMVKWCPSTPHCGNAIRVDDDEMCEVECSCGFQFCFRCSSQAHSPCSCLMWERWRKNESETVNWLTVHTKSCPKCHKFVQKNGGCNLVNCICGQPFCWLCGGATGRDHNWSRITGHSCGRYKENNAREMARAQRDLLRYTHYHDRYKAHRDSSMREDRRKGIILKKVEKSELQNKDFSWITNGLHRLIRSRQILSYSYPFAFYMFGEEMFKDEMSIEERVIKRNLFEDQQQQLETNIEKLSKFLEEPFDEYFDENVMQMRIEVINLSAAVDTLCQKMYECIENDLLGSLQLGIHNIAPYRSNGIERASNFYDSKEVAVGEISQPSSSGTSGCGWDSEETSCSLKKRPRIDAGCRNSKSISLDLNLPAEEK